VTISPKRGGLTVNQTLPVTATVTNDSQNKGVSWTATGGSFSSPTSASGAPVNYTAPAAAGVYTLTATSVSDNSKLATITIGVTDLPGVFTYHNDLSRDGINISECALTTATVKTASFGLLFSCKVDGAIYAQPMWVANVIIGAAKHNVVVVATQHDSVFAFDGDANPCVQLWKANLLDPQNHGATAGETSVPSGIGGLVGNGFGDVTPETGITGTPVIDPATNTLYILSKSVNQAVPTFYQRLHALDLTTGSEKFKGPVTISASVPGNAPDAVNAQVNFDPRNEHRRPGLALVNGNVYIAWASHEDHDQYHGWVIGYNATTLSQTGVFNTTPNTVAPSTYARGGIWMGGGAPAADSANNLYFLTGNGTFDAASGGQNFGDSTMKLSTSAGLTVADWFTPASQASLDANDEDHGSGGAAILVDQAVGPHPHLVIGGTLYLLDRTAMGNYGGSTVPPNAAAVQTFNIGNPIFATSAFWNNTLYIAPAGGPLQSYVFNPATSMFNTAAATQTANSFGFPGSTPSVSASPSGNVIVWALDVSQYCTPPIPLCGPAVLHAYDATNLSTELWNSSQGTAAGFAVKFTVPTVANGKVYIGTRGNDTGTGVPTNPGELDVFGLLPN